MTPSRTNDESDRSETGGQRFEERRNEQNERLRKVLHLLAKLPAAKRQRYQLLVIRCGRCGDVLVEVVQTLEYPVVHYRQTTRHPAAKPVPPDADAAARVRANREAGEPVRQGDWTFYPLPQPIPRATDDQGALIPACCRCTQVPLTEGFLLQLIQDGIRKKVLHPTQ